MQPSTSNHLRKPAGALARLLALALVAGLTGCLGGGNAGGTATTSGAATGTATGTATGSGATGTTAVVFSGSVGDGPVTGATVRVLNNSGVLLGTAVTDSTAVFHASINARASDYPLWLEVNNGVDLVTGAAPDYTLMSLLQRATDTRANINPFTTMMVKVAEKLPGGVGNSNLFTARSTVLNRLGFGLDTTVVSNPFTVAVGNSNVAQVVKASEAMGEWIRRTSAMAGRSASAVMNALAADLTDGNLDGLGAAGTDARVTAVANVMSSQVLVETMGNHLQVGGADAVGVMNQAIQSTHPGISSSQLTGSVRVTAQLILQAQVALAAAQVLDNSSAVQSLATTVGNLQANSSSSSVSSVLPASSTDSLQAATLLSQSITNGEISSINQLPFAAPDSSGTGSGSGTGSSGSGSGTGTGTGGSGTGTGGSGTGTGGSGTGTGTGSGTGTGGGTPAPGSLTLSWTAPSTRSDGTPLSLADISGYRIYYRTALASYTAHVNVSNGSAQSATISNLVAGTSYFLAMTTLDSAGLESAYSAEVSKTAR
jgi:Fibronectin type III domain